ncbi:ATP-binding protein, partial [Microbaculum marinum]
MRIDWRQPGKGGLVPPLSAVAISTAALCNGALSTVARILPLAAVTLLLPAVAWAQAGGGSLDLGTELRRQITDVHTSVSQEELAALSLFLGILFFAVLAAILYVRTRARLQLAERAAQERIGELSARVERAEGLLAVDQNVLVVWPLDGGEPEIHCDPGPSRVLPSRRGDVLAFGKWLDPESALDLEKQIVALRSRGESFNLTLRTRIRRGETAAEAGFVEADGRSAAGRAVLRIRDLAGQRRELADISDRHKRLARDVEALRALLDTVPMPAWLCDAEGRLSWANRAYARAVGADSGAAAVDAGIELLDATERNQLDADRRDDGVAHRQMSLAVGRAQRMHDVWDVDGERYRAGIAIDIADAETLRRQLARRDDTHARTLDLVATAVAAFGPDQRLNYYNRMFGQLWGLDAAFLNAGPGFDEILDRLRAAGRIQEPVDYRDWRADQLSVFTSADTVDAARRTLWHLPDGRTVSVVMTRQADGSVSALFEDVTQSLDLESRVVALTEVQRETLDSLDEGIAVFGTDGLLKLYNPAFSEIWRLSGDRLGSQPHVEAVIGWCRDLYDDTAVWASLRAVVTSLQDSREALSRRLERPDRSVIDLRAVPLPDGATLVVFTDVSDSARIEKALRDRNEALITASRIKNEFVHKVSYELRAPLTNIIGFAQLMSDGEPGAMSERQREYAGHILSSSSALLAIINDILDLATVDAGVMELDIGEVDIRAAVTAAAESLNDRLASSGITLDLDVPEDIGTMQADEKRIRQILFNLLSNAIGFSDPGHAVALGVSRDRTGRVTFAVRDEGPGIPDDVRRAVFDRFESYSLGTRHRGAGLGLSIVKSFVELHGGEVRLDSSPGRGTTVACVLPARQPLRAAARSEDGAPGATIHELDLP